MRKNLSKKLCRLALLCLALPLLLSLSPAERQGRLDGRVSMTARILEISDRILFIDEGVIKEQGTPEEVFGAPKHPRLKDFLSKVL